MLLQSKGKQIRLQRRSDHLRLRPSPSLPPVLPLTNMCRFVCMFDVNVHVCIVVPPCALIRFCDV